jgi:hypothetical protein
MHIDNNGIHVLGQESIAVSYPDHGNEDCFAIEKNSFWFNHRNEVIREVMQKFPFSGNFADIGGGNGYQASYIRNNFPGKDVFLVEPGYQGCLNAKRSGLENVYNMSFQDFDFTGNNIRGIGLFDVVEHIDDDVSFMRGIAEKCGKGGLIFVTVPAYNWLWSDIDNYSGHFRRYNSGMIKKLAKDAGLELLYNGYFMFYLILPILFGRSLLYRIRGKRDEKQINEQAGKNHKSGGLSAVIINILDKIELSMIRGSGKIPAGGSCIAVFRT